MSTVGGLYLDIAEIKKGKCGNEVADIINMLSQTNGILDDAIWRECNSGTRHKHTVLSGLPDVSWGRLYKGIKNGRAKRTQVEDVTGFIEGLSTVDERLTELEPNVNAFRLQEAEAFMESLGQTMASSIIYEDADANPDRFTGLAPRFNDLSAQNGNQIIDAGGTGSDNTSIWFVTWGPAACQLIYPQGTSAGVTRKDLGSQRVHDENGDPYFALEEKFTVHLGVSVRDWRKVVRIANIDVSELEAGNVDIYDLMRKAFNKVHGLRKSARGTDSVASGDGNFMNPRTAIYCNDVVFEALDRETNNSRKSGSDNFIRMRPTEIQGNEVDAYRSIPVVQVDAILKTEARVV